MKNIEVLIMCLLLFLNWSLCAQVEMEIEGKLILTEMDTVQGDNLLLVRKEDGVLAVANASLASPASLTQSIPYESDWIDHPNGQPGIMYKADDRVYLSGRLRKTSGDVANNDVIAYLPEEFRPRKRMLVYAFHWSKAIRLNIEPDGKIWVVSGALNGVNGNDFLNLAGISFYRKEIEIGSIYKGGIVFHLFDPPEDVNGDGILDYGMVAASEDFAPTQWGCIGQLINGADGELIGNGMQNTIDILSDCTDTNIAAQLCDDLIENGYDDWFLPSTEALHIMNSQIGFGATGSNYNIGNFMDGTAGNSYYWSSTEHSQNFAWTKNFLNFLPVYTLSGKSSPNWRIRAVRIF